MLVFPSSRRHKNCVFCQFLDDLPPPNPAYITSLRISWASIRVFPRENHQVISVRALSLGSGSCETAASGPFCAHDIVVLQVGADA